jgi:hypothetical protein
MRSQRRAVLGSLTVLLAATSSSTARAQVAPALGPDSFLVVVPVRDTVEIQRDVGSALQARTQAELDRSRAESLRGSARVRITRKEGEINTIKQRIKAANDEKRSTDAAALEADRKAAEQDLNLLRRREALRDAEIELEKKKGELADARRKALELELQLTIRRLAQDRAGGPDSSEDALTRKLVGDLEKQTLEAQQDEVAKSKEVADRRALIIKRRLEILEAQHRIAARGQDGGAPPQ